MTEFTIPLISFSAIAPETALLVTGIIVMLLSATSPAFSRRYAPYISLAGCAVALFLLRGMSEVTGTYYSGMLTLDSYGWFFRVLFVLIAAGAILISIGYLSSMKLLYGEYYALLLFAVVGMMSMVTSMELLVIFIGIEILSVGLYAMAGFQRENVYSIEAAVKYFLLGAFSTSFFLFGIALIYGATGETNLREIAAVIIRGEMARAELIGPGLALLLVGFLFKISAFPFHMWTPDVYQGAPTPVTAFMAVGPKIAGFAALTRILVTAFPTVRPEWTQIAVVICAATMLVGNFAALRQNNIKRMLAYSSIAHVGYVLMALVAGGTPAAVQAMAFYLAAYTAMNFAAFGAVIALTREQRELTEIDQYGGVAFKYPFVAAVLALSLLSLAGIPPTAGFLGKFFVFKAAFEQGHTYLVVFAVLNSALSLYYYLRPVIYCYMKPQTVEVEGATVFTSLAVLLLVASGVILFLGIYPASFYRVILRSVLSLYSATLTL